jgi:hypothetical protein
MSMNLHRITCNGETSAWHTEAALVNLNAVSYDLTAKTGNLHEVQTVQLEAGHLCTYDGEPGKVDNLNGVPVVQLDCGTRVIPLMPAFEYLAI